MAGLKHLPRLHKRKLIHGSKCPLCFNRLSKSKMKNSLFLYCDCCHLYISFKKSLLSSISRSILIGNSVTWFHTFYADNKLFFNYNKKHFNSVELNIDTFYITDHFKLESRFLMNEILE